MMSRLKMMVSKKNRVKKEEASNGSSSHSASGKNISLNPEPEEQHNNPGKDKKELKPHRQLTNEQQADDLKNISTQCRQEGASNTVGDSNYPSLQKGPDTRCMVVPPGQSGIAGAAALLQSGHVDGLGSNAQLHVSSEEASNEPSVSRGVQKSADLLNQMSIDDNRTQARQGENPVPQSSRGLQQRNEDLLNQDRTMVEPFGQSGQVNEGLGSVGEGEDEDHEQQIHAQEEVAPSEQPLGLLENKSLMEKIALMLNPYNPVIKNWESLAYELRAPPSIRAQCKRLTHHSQTRVLFETLSTSVKTEDLRVNKLIDVLNSLKRRDVVELLQKKIIPAARLQNKVSEEVTSNDELMEELETLLDKESRVVKNWYYLGLKLGLSKETLQEIKDGNNPHNGVPALFAFIYSKRPNLSVDEFKTIMKDINRKDIVDKLSDVGPGLVKKHFPLDSDEMRSLCYLLNKNSCGTVKDWRHLAIKLDIDYEQYKTFEKETTEIPTVVLIDWALTENPSMTVQHLCNLFKNMKRYDVIETIEQYYGCSFIAESQSIN